MRVQKIHFNHDLNSAKHDAINLKFDERAALGTAEWSDGLTRKPAVYARSIIKPPVTIKVVFGDGPANEAVEVRAVAGAQESPAPDGVDPPGRESPLGDVLSELVRFDHNGNSQPVTFKVTGRPDIAAVGKWVFALTWQVPADPRGTWRAFAKTAHLVYVIPALPNPPWTQDPNDPQGWELPWDRAIDKACLWAAGTWSPDTSAAAIARAINEHPLHLYSKVGSLVDLGDPPNKVPPTFKLDEYLDRLDYGAPFTMNCRDVATTVMTFANLLGSNLWPVSTRNGFITNPVRALVELNFGVQDWTFHEVAATQQSLPAGYQADADLTSGPDELVRIYDACVRLPGEILPLDMPFGSVPNSTGYRFGLIDTTISTGNGEPARPRPRRYVI